MTYGQISTNYLFASCNFSCKASSNILQISTTKFKLNTMSIWRVILCIIFPPLAVIDKGCGSVILVLILTLCGWIPGVIAALIIVKK